MTALYVISGDLLQTGFLNGGAIPTQKDGVPFDTCSIQTITEPPGTSFGTGVLTVTKSNVPDTVGAAVTGGSITTETVTELTGSNWFKAGFLQFRVTTAAAASVKFKVIVRFARLGFSV